MIIKIDVRPTRLLITKGNGIIGTQNENNAIKIKFCFPPKLAGVDIDDYTVKKAIISNSNGDFPLEIDSDNCITISSAYTSDTFLDIKVELTNGETVWSTRPRRFYLNTNDRTSNAEINADVFIPQLIASLNESGVTQLSINSSAQEILDAINNSVNWQAFKSELITAINDKFGTELAENISSDDLISTISELVDGNAVKSFFIELLNDSAEYINTQENDGAVPLTLLDDTMTDNEIITAIESNFDGLGKTMSYYLSVRSALIFYLTRLNEAVEIPLDSSADDTPLADQLGSVAERYYGLANSVINVLSDGGIHFDGVPSPSDVSSAVSSAFETQTSTINSMYSLYTGGTVNA